MLFIIDALGLSKERDEISDPISLLFLQIYLSIAFFWVGQQGFHTPQRFAENEQNRPETQRLNPKAMKESAIEPFS
jgi:hypothetical protein